MPPAGSSTSSPPWPRRPSARQPPGRPGRRPRDASLHLLRGDDEVLLGEATTDLVHRLVGDGDRSLVVTELDGDDYAVTAVVDAAQTPRS